MRTYIVIHNNGVSCSAHGPWTSEDAADRFVAFKGLSIWRDLFPHEEYPAKNFSEILQERAGNKFFLIPVVPPNEQAEFEDDIPCLFQQ